MPGPKAGRPSAVVWNPRFLSLSAKKKSKKDAQKETGGGRSSRRPRDSGAFPSISCSETTPRLAIKGGQQITTSIIFYYESG